MSKVGHHLYDFIKTSFRPEKGGREKKHDMISKNESEKAQK